VSDTPAITVIYLWRFGNPPHFARRFLESLIRYPAGLDYKLLYLLKGFPEDKKDEEFEALRDQLPCHAETLAVSDDLYITSAHLAGAESEFCDTEFVFPLTSWTEVLASNWLLHFANAYKNTPNCGIVGATGSFESIGDTTPFPNVCIRTTAFFMKREDFIRAERGPLETKYDNNLMEAGPNSLSKQMLDHGRALVVVDKFGTVHAPSAWPESLTYRAGHQENLLITDNRPHHYDKENNRRRKRLARHAWGSQINVPWNPPWRRLWVHLRYKYDLFVR